MDVWLASKRRAIRNSRTMTTGSHILNGSGTRADVETPSTSVIGMNPNMNLSMSGFMLNFTPTPIIAIGRKTAKLDIDTARILLGMCPGATCFANSRHGIVNALHMERDAIKATTANMLRIVVRMVFLPNALDQT